MEISTFQKLYMLSQKKQIFFYKSSFGYAFVTTFKLPTPSKLRVLYSF